MDIRYTNSSYVFPLERNFDKDAAKTYMIDYWKWSFLYAFLYVCCIRLAQRLMRDRPAFNLRPALVLWSGFLAAFSIMGVVRITPYLQHLYMDQGLQGLLCDQKEIMYEVVPYSFWSYYFPISKLWEFGDTAFLVLRKKPVSFLHWYHHVTVFIYCWYSFSVRSSVGTMFAIVNTGVHALMYTYYTLKALQVPLSRRVSMTVTTVQLSQMFVGVAAIIATVGLRSTGVACPDGPVTLAWGSAMYLSYMILFANFFYRAYLVKRHTKAKASANGCTNGVASHAVTNGKVKSQ